MKWDWNIQIYYFEDMFMARFRSARSSEEVREYNVNYDNYIMGKTNLYKIKPIFFQLTE